MRLRPGWDWMFDACLPEIVDINVSSANQTTHLSIYPTPTPNHTQSCAPTCEDRIASASNGGVPVLKACNRMCYQRCECLPDHLLLEVRCWVGGWLWGCVGRGG